MKSPNITSGRQVKTSANWFHGVNSVKHPWYLPEDQLKWGVNVSMRGGIAQTRPGQSMRLSMPPGNLQGGIVFSANKQYQAASVTETSGGVVTQLATIYNYDGTYSTESELSYIVFVVDGSVYFSPFPLEQPKSWEDYKLQNIKLDPNVDEVVLTIATQSAKINSGGEITVTPSHRILIIQDGISRPAYWDGSDQLGGQSTTMPIGKWMAYSGNRLWVSSGNIVSASDLADPLSWTERASGAGRGDFSFARPVTGMVSYVGQNTDTRLIVFSDRATYSLASGVLDRAQWATTSNFQNTLFPTVGCIAGKSITFQAGMVWWYSQGGLIAVDVAAASYLSSQVLYKDVEMARAKRLMPANQTKVCAASFENYLLISVPYLEVLNSNTMVLDYAPASELSGVKQPAWCGVWTGTRPIEWSSGFIGGQSRIFQFSVDYAPTNDGSYNHVWESFMPERVDTFLQLNPNGPPTELYNRIYCQMETGMMGESMDLKQLAYGEIEASQIGGTVDVRISYRGSKGPYLPILDSRLLSVTSNYQYDNTPFTDEIDALGLLNTQYRRIVTESVIRTAASESCESNLTMDVDKAFSFLVEWCGEMGVEAVRMFMDPWSERSTGEPQKEEAKSCVVGELGESLTVDLIPNPSIDPSTGARLSWSATESYTTTIECPDNPEQLSVAATATSSFISYVSLADARQQALTLAHQAADAAAQQYRQQNPC